MLPALMVFTHKNFVVLVHFHEMRIYDFIPHMHRPFDFYNWIKISNDVDFATPLVFPHLPETTKKKANKMLKFWHIEK